MIRRFVVMVALAGAAVAFAYRFQAPGQQSDESALGVEPETSSTMGPDGSTTTTSVAVERTTTTTVTTTTIAIPAETAGGDVFGGSRIYTNWGWVKVEIRVVDGVMVDIDLVMIPRATKRSVALSLEYEPTLREQALVRQSPDVDIISGATVISDGYRRSLMGAMKDAAIWSPPDR